MLDHVCVCAADDRRLDGDRDGDVERFAVHAGRPDLDRRRACRRGRAAEPHLISQAVTVQPQPVRQRPLDDLVSDLRAVRGRGVALQYLAVTVLVSGHIVACCAGERDGLRDRKVDRDDKRRIAACRGDLDRRCAGRRGRAADDAVAERQPCGQRPLRDLISRRGAVRRRHVERLRQRMPFFAADAVRRRTGELDLQKQRERVKALLDRRIGGDLDSPRRQDADQAVAARSDFCQDVG